MSRHSFPTFHFPVRMFPFALLAAAELCFSQTAFAGPTANSLKMVENNRHANGVDNGWVIDDSTVSNPTLIAYTKNASGDFVATKKIKMKTALSLGGFTMAAGGVVFAPAPQGQGKSVLSVSGSGLFGVGLGFGEVSVGGAGGSEGGWASDVTVTAHDTNPNLVPGAISGLAADPVNGTYAVGWDTDNPGGVDHAIVMTLNSAGPTYKPMSQTDLGTLGGSTSQALGISKGATYVVGAADDSAGNAHAVYAHLPATSWTDLTTGFPATINGGNVVKSRALAANDAGIVAGAVKVKEDVAGRKNLPVDIGFIYNIGTNSTVFFPFAGANVIPMKVLADGGVLGDLEFVVPAGSPAGTLPVHHPFLFDGTNVTDFGVMTLVSTGQPAYGCRAAAVNGNGEIAGSCTANATDTYANAVSGFYINATGVSPAFVDLNTKLHATMDSLNAKIKPYKFTNATSVDDQQEITLTGKKTTKSSQTLTSFVVSKNAYQ